MRPFQHLIRPEDVDELIDLRVTGAPETGAMATLQREGVAALYNVLCERPFAYLADEVGMGKTYQALSLAALVWNENPRARVLFLSPRENVQVKWLGDYRRFFASNFRRAQGVGDDRVASMLFGEPLHRPRRFGNLRDWAGSVGRPGRVASFLRHSSFTRPVYVTSADRKDLEALWRRTERSLRECGLWWDAERPEALCEKDASHQLNLAFAKALNRKLGREAGSEPYF